MKVIQKKQRSETLVIAEAGFRGVSPRHYLPYLETLHQRLKPRVYFEIGTQSGASLSYATCTSIAVDPQFQLQADISRNKPELHQYQGTSDAFFASRLLERLGLQIDLAFLDGLHLFEQLLKDFLNTEMHMAPDGVITMHDCVPYNRLIAERSWDRTRTANWTGDVWKLVPILREYRPDLAVAVMDLAPTGLVEVRRLDPQNRVLNDNFDAIVARFMPVTLDSFGLAAFREMMAPPPPPELAKPASGKTLAAAVLQRKPVFSAWERPRHAAAQVLNVAVKIAVPGPRRKLVGGDFHFARGLADGLLDAGHSVKIDSIKEWYSASDKTDVDLVLFGARKFSPQPGIPFVGWVIYPGPDEDELLGCSDQARHMFFASDAALRQHLKRFPDRPASSLMQGFDRSVMYPSEEPKSQDLVFVGNNHFRGPGARPMVDMAAAAGIGLRLWGQGWQEHPIFPSLVEVYLPNNQLGDVYRRARAVLCDHMPLMREQGYVSNRIFDALACGTAVISDPIAGLPDAFRPYVHLCETAAELTAAVADIRSEGAEKQEKRRLFAIEMRERHSLHNRAETILSVLSGQKAAAGPQAAAKTG